MEEQYERSSTPATIPSPTSRRGFCNVIGAYGHLQERLTTPVTASSTTPSVNPSHIPFSPEGSLKVDQRTHIPFVSEGDHTKHDNCICKFADEL